MPTPFDEPIEVTLRNGRSASIRPIRPDDIPRTAAFIEGLSSESTHSLFLGGIVRLSDAELRRLCDPGDARDMAYVATVHGADGEQEIGMCRYAGADSPSGAEISVAVADDWQHQGLGTLLLHRLIDHARTHDVRRLYSIDNASNQAIRRLAHALGFREQRDPDDIHQVIYSLQPA
jgi:RimJ/RimL family protein N-acetyltransferase